MTTRPPIVVGYNGKDNSRRALAWAAREARQRHAALRILYAANYPGMTHPAEVPDPGALEAAEEVTAMGTAEARTVAPDLHITGMTKVAGPAKALIDASSAAQLTVIGTRGRGSILGTLLGSVAFAVAGRASCPVVIVKGDLTRHVQRPDEGVVVGTDGSPAAENAVRHAADFAVEWSTHLEVVCGTGTWVPAEQERCHRGAEGITTQAVAALRESHPGLRVRARVADTAPEEALVDASATAALVVVGSRGRGAFDRLLLGSVSHAVIHAARCPVAVISDTAGATLGRGVTRASAQQPRLGPA